jgi:hypothetical protein
MATINQHYAKDGTLSYRVRVRMKGQPLQTASFPTLRGAQKWAKLHEGEMLAGKHFPAKKPQRTLSEFIKRYFKEVHSHKSPKTQRREAFILRYC